jgi:hypothetical protein
MGFAADAAPTAEQIEFFEKSVRPVLLNRCASCHGADEQEAGLRLDTKAAALKGSTAGAVIVPGDPDKSRLLHVVGYTEDVQMPPDEKLPEAEIAALREWVKQGAAWPGEAEPAAPPPESQDSSSAIDAARASHWAFQPIARLAIPAVRDAGWPKGDIDTFILAELEKAGLAPSPAASRAVWIRRATYDLIGLPPTREEIEAFERDGAADAYEKVVDRLLASPHYGERWGRHWLDVARYADTKGYVFTEDPRFPYSYTYRDYVVRSLNEDVPYDRFLLEQLAADQLGLGDDQRALAGMGFLTVGSRFMHNIHDIIDDRIDVVCRGLMGLTVTCARCHDHKFDPVPMADYYSLYGVFASSVEPSEKPLVAMPEENEAYLKHQAEATMRQQALDGYLATHLEELRSGARTRVAEYLAKAIAGGAAPIPEGAMLSLQPDELKPGVTQRWREYLAETAKAPHAVFAPWHALAALKPEDFLTQAPALVANLPTEVAGGAPPVNRLVKDALVKGPLASMTDVARIYGELLAAIEGQWREAQRVAASAGGEPLKALPDPASEELRQVLYADGAPCMVAKADIEKQYDFFLDRTVANEYNRLKRELEGWKAQSPAEPPRAMTLVDQPTPHEPHIFLRGKPGQAGEVVPRQFLRVLAGPERKPFEHGSGRLDMAQAIVAGDNPLTARVMVNRVWMHHFGAPLVSTPSDFGVRCDPPSHPALLDYLAATFRDDGWSLKRLHRRLMLSAVYRQSSAGSADGEQVDPENRLYWRMNRRRLEFESARDSLLAAAGRLDRAIGGRPVALSQQPYSTRRTIYGVIDRGDLPGLYRAFDFAAPDATTPQRPRTTVPQQALFLMNSPFVMEQARGVAARPEVAAAEGSNRVRAMYEAVLGRGATPVEVRQALDFVEQSPPTEVKDPASAWGPWEQLAQVLLETNEFMFVD